MRNLPLKGLRAKPNSPLRKFSNPFAKGDKGDINATMEQVKEEEFDDTASEGLNPCLLSGGEKMRLKKGTLKGR
jgi:hypothetical protein